MGIAIHEISLVLVSATENLLLLTFVDLVPNVLFVVGRGVVYHDVMGVADCLCAFIL